MSNQRPIGVGNLTELTQDIFDESTTDNNVGFKSLGLTSKNLINFHTNIFIVFNRSSV
jgi:hypothetical protein